MISTQLIPLFLQGAALGVTAAAAPGPFQTYLINQTLTGGWRRGLPVAFAPLVSDPPIVLFILLVLDQLSARFINLISLVGGIFVFYLAWGLWQQWRKESNPDASTDKSLSAVKEPEDRDRLPTSTSGALGRGALMNILSPGPYTFWTLVLGPILLAALQQSPLHGIAFLLGFYSTFIGGLVALVVLFHQARRLGPRLVRGLTLLSILILVVFGGILLWQGVS